MGLSGVPASERVHIGFFGKRNAGKSSLVNAITGQEMSVVSDVPGTTTDPVRKTMELLPIGPVVIIDTPGLDDTGELGAKRVSKAQEILATADVAVLVTSSPVLTPLEEELVSLFKSGSVPYVIAHTKADLPGERPPLPPNEIYVSSFTGENIRELKELIGKVNSASGTVRPLVSDLVSQGDIVVLVIPVDESAPKGRLILPQQLVMRDLLDCGCSFVGCQPSELSATLSSLSVSPALVITDSQAFSQVAAAVPGSVPLTSFSILMARYKGDLERLVRGAEKLDSLKDGDRVLISEGCTHHRQCKDIGTVKLPGLIRRYTGKDLEFSFTSGKDFPEDLSGYDLVVHCGGCMLSEKEMLHRQRVSDGAYVPMVNYGVAIAKMNGILERSLKPLGDLSS